MPLILETNHGSYELSGSPDESIASILRRARVPVSAVWTFGVPRSPANAPIEFVSSTTPFGAAEARYAKVVATLSRNVELPSTSRNIEVPVREVAHPATEWEFPSSDSGMFAPVLTHLTQDECYRLVASNVDEVLSQWPIGDDKIIVVGTSGGGDSNVMLSCLNNSPHFTSGHIIPVMVLGLPDWDKQLEQAQALCTSLSLTLTVIDSTAAASILGGTSFDRIAHTFREFYPDTDLDFLGTWVLRRVLGAHAISQGVGYVAIGGNREDVVSEGLARVVQGKPPLPAPYRTIGQTTFVYPMWKVPKKIGDGAYAHYSLENYHNRSPGRTKGRSAFYYLAYALADMAPGADLTLLEGLAQLAQSAPHPFSKSADIDDYIITDAVSADDIQRWQSFQAAALGVQQTPRH